MEAPTYAGVGTALQTINAFGHQPDVVGIARGAEAAGLDHVWIPDHLLFHRPILEAFMTAAVVAGATERIRLGFAVLNGVLRPPVWFAKQLATLAELAPDRLAAIGIGVGGEFAPEFEAAGVELKGRGARLNAMLGELPGLLTGAGPGLAPAMATPPPILIGGRADAALRRCALHGDAWLPMWMDAIKIAEAHTRIQEIAREHSRPEPGLMYLAFANVCDDPARGREEAATMIKAQYGMPLEKVERWTLIGPAEQIADRLREYRDIGAEGFVLSPATPDPATQMDGIGAVKEALAS